MGTREELRFVQTLLFQQFVVHEKLIVVAGLDIACLSPLGAEVHVQQVGGTIDIESACRNAVLVIVGGIRLDLAGTGHDEQHVLFAEFLFEGGDELSKFAVQTQLGVFLFRLTICHRLVLVETCIVIQTKQVCDAVRA